MARIGVSKDDVFAACKTLLKDGRNLTVANVREELGTGSYTTILPFIDQFRISIKEAIEKSTDSSSGIPALPNDLGDLGSKFIQDLWWQATNHAQKRVDEMTLKFKKEVGEIKDALDAKVEELGQAVSDITHLEKDFELAQRLGEERMRSLSEKDGEISLLKAQLKEKDQESKAYLERAIAAEKKLEFTQKEKQK
jgi:ATP-dependent Zn protease